MRKLSSGKEVIIARGSEPVAKLVPIAATRSEREPGKFAGQITSTADAFEPLKENKLRDLGFKE